MSSFTLKALLFLSLTNLTLSVFRQPSAILTEVYRNVTAEFKELRKLTGLSPRNQAKVNSYLEKQYSTQLADLEDVDESNLDEVVRAIDHMKMIEAFVEEQMEWRKKDYATLIWLALQRVSDWKRYLPEKTQALGYPRHVGNVTSKKYY